QQLRLRHRAQGAGTLVDVLGHVGQAQRVRRYAPAAGRVEAGEVRLGGVDQVSDHVADLPVTGAGGRLPPLWVGRQRQHALGLAAPDPVDVPAAAGLQEVPAHDRPPHVDRSAQRSPGRWRASSSLRPETGGVHPAREGVAGRPTGPRLDPVGPADPRGCRGVDDMAMALSRTPFRARGAEVQAAVERLAGETLDGNSLVRRLAGIFRAAVPADGLLLLRTDPTTVLPTDGVVEE